MRKNITLLAIAALGMVAFFSCKKSDNNNASTSASMTATIGNSSYSTSSCIAAVNDTILVVYGGISSLGSLTYPYVGLSVTNYTGKGTYTINGTNLNSAVVDSSSSTGVSAVSGTITITSTSPNIVGTFNFQGIDFSLDTVNVTKGAFTAKLIQ